MPIPKEGSRDARRLANGNKRIPIQVITLRTIYAVGALSTILIAPHLLRLFPSVDRGKAKRKEMYGRIDQALYRLRGKGFISFSKTEGRRPIAHLTKRGKIEIEKIILGQYLISETTIWDGKWRIIIFDIREKRRRVRQRLRALLHGAGVVRLQDSVWVHPYPCDEFVALLRGHLKIGTGELLYFTCEGFQSDRRLRDHFNLQ